MRFDFSDEEWALLEPLMPEARKSARTDDRRIMNTIFYVLRTGMPWCNLPERYGPYTTVCIPNIRFSMDAESRPLPTAGKILAEISGGKVGGDEHDRTTPERIKATIY